MTRTRKVAAMAALLSLLFVAACDDGAAEPSSPAGIGALTEAAAKNPIAAPSPGGKAGFGPNAPVPVETVASPLAGQALPTNQWWTSALTGSPSMRRPCGWPGAGTR